MSIDLTQKISVILAGLDARLTAAAASAFSMTKLATAMNATKANTADTYIGTEGDSTDMGRGTGTGSVGTDGARANSATANFAARLKVLTNLAVRTDAFFGSGQVGDITQYVAYNPLVAVGTDWVLSGTDTAGGVIFAKSSANAGAFTHTSTQPWDQVDIYTPQDTGYTGTLVCKIDGGTATNIAQAGTKTVKKTTLTAGSLANHTLSMDSLDANGVQLLGCVFRNSATKSVIVINMGARGWTASRWASTNATWSPASMAAFIGFHALFYANGINDFRDGSTLTQSAFLASVTTNLNLVKASTDIIMKAPTDISSGSNNGTLTMTQVGAVYKQYAGDNGYGYLDTIAAVGNYATVSAAGNMYDNLHYKAPVAVTLGMAMGDYAYAALQRAGFTPAASTAAASTPTVALSPAQSKAEGNSGATVYTFTVSRSTTSGAISVPWSFLASGTDASDYTGSVLPAGGTVAIADGAASGTFSISVNGDTTVEQDEMFGVSIAAPSGYSLGSPSSITNTINNDDASATPNVSLSAAQSKSEGNSGPTLFTYTVTRSNSSGAINVPWSFAAGGTDASDYTSGALPSGGTVAIADGVTAGTFSVSVNGDTAVESDETFTVSITAPSGYVLGSTSSASGIILNDDSSGSTYTATGKSAKQHYGSGAGGTQPDEKPAGFNNFAIAAATTSKALVTPAGATTGWATVSNPKVSNLGSLQVGSQTGNDSGVYPDLALLGNWYTADNTAGQTEVYSGLDPAKYYDVYVCGSRAGTGRGIVVTASGATTPASQTLVVDNNTTLRTLHAKLQPNSSGVINVNWRSTSTANGVMCVIELVEFTGP